MRQTLVVPDPLADLAQLEGVPAAVASARAAVDVVLRDRGLRTTTPAQSAAALDSSARASAELSGDAGRWLTGCLRLSAELVELSALICRSPGQVLARAHTLVAHGQVPDDALGQVRPGADVAARMGDLRSLLTGPTAAPAALLAAVAHAEIVTTGPFGTAADGIVARAAEHMVLIASGVDPRGVIVIEAGHLTLRASYQRALTGYARAGGTGVHGWLMHCAAALAAGAEASPLAGPPTAMLPRER